MSAGIEIAPVRTLRRKSSRNSLSKTVTTAGDESTLRRVLEDEGAHETPFTDETQGRSVCQLKPTFQNQKLEVAFVRYCQLTQWPSASPQTLESRVKKLLKQEIEFIGNPSFASEGAEDAVLGDDILAVAFLSPRRSKKIPDLPSHLKRLCEMQLLQHDEERVLFQRMNFLRYRAHLIRSQLDPKTSTEWDVVRIQSLLKAADWHRDLIVRSNMRLVMSIIKKFVNANNAFDDLLSDGAMAIMRAVDKFDYDRGFRFSTYATQVVRRNAYRTIMQRQNDKLRTAISTEESGVDVCEVERTGIDENRWQLLRSRLAEMLDQLDRREKLIIRARFSLGSHRRVQTLQRLAEVLGVSKERVRQIEKRALEKLRALVDKSPLPVAEITD